MNPDLDICTQGLGKRYRLGMTVDLNRTFRETLMTLPGYVGRRARTAIEQRRRNAENGDDPQTPEGTFWALREVSLEVRRGEVVGIIGRNGAGKSTLLKILSRVTQPTAGSAQIRGRVGALLEVGTGFHPELSGRENVYLNGAILGMRRAEIDRKFDEIVAFAEVESFLETPVKRYSNGMRVRLGFAVAAHLDPEILIIDEVLSVGDAAFRKKCLEKMESVAGEGRTVLFISHNMASIRSLCPRAILLDHGRVVCDGPSEDVVARYLGEQGDGLAERRWGEQGEPLPGSTTAQLVSARLKEPGSENGRGRFSCDEPIDLEIKYRVLRPSDVFAEFHVKDSEGQRLFVAGEFQEMEWQNRTKESGEYGVICHLPANFFNEGTHSIDIDLITLNPSQVHAHAPDSLVFTVQDDREVGGARGFRIRARWPVSAVRPKFTYDFYRDGEKL